GQSSPPSTATSGASSSSAPFSAGISSGSTLVDVNATPGDYAAPSQLKCSSRQYPDSGPFLESPFTGWASINSFLDHDSPDYAQDGDIVLANGLHAHASAGQDS